MRRASDPRGSKTRPAAWWSGGEAIRHQLMTGQADLLGLRLHFRHDALTNGEERVGADGVELLALLFLELGEGGVGGQALAVGAVGSHGIKGVAHGHDAS